MTAWSDFSQPVLLHNDTPVSCERDVLINALYEAQASLKLLEALIRCDPEPTLPVVAIRYIASLRSALEDQMPSLKQH